jgi:hypothetical protein
LLCAGGRHVRASAGQPVAAGAASAEGAPHVPHV